MELLSSDSAMTGFKKKLPRVLEIVDDDTNDEASPKPAKTTSRKESPKKKSKVELAASSPVVSKKEEESVVASSPSKTTASANKKFNYGDYLKRKQQGPAAPGSKEIPTGSPNCLEGLTFVFSGELSSISRDDSADLVKRYGARVTSAVSHRTSYLVVGEGAGDSKTAKAKEWGLGVLDEDGLFDLIRSKSSTTPATKPKVESPKKQTAIHKKRTLEEDDEDIYDEKEKAPVGSIFTSPELITTKYAPKGEADLIGNATPFRNLVDWLSSWYSSHFLIS